jgi:hypothetical protein
VSCCLVREYSGHKDGIWEVAVARPGQPIIGTAAAGGFGSWSQSMFKLHKDTLGTYKYKIVLGTLLKHYSSSHFDH